MKKSRIVPRIGGALIALLVLLALLSCAETSKDPAEETTEITDTAEVSAGTESPTGSTEANDTSASTGSSETDAASSSADSSASSSSPSDSSAVIDDDSETVEAYLTYLSSRSLEASDPEYTTISSDKLYWTYTAEKKDSYFSTGQTDSETPLNTDDDGNALLGLPADAFGTFSVGTWLFQFYAYEVTKTDSSEDAVVTVTTDDGTIYYALGDLYYSGEDYDGEDYYTTLTTEKNTVSVNVQLVEAEGNGSVNLSLSLTESITADYVLFYSINDGELVEDEDKAMLTDDGITVTDLEPGYYSLYACLADSGGTIYAQSEIDDFIVRGGLTTYVTGTLDEVTVEVYLGDLSVTYETISVSSESALTAALALDGATVVLTEGVELESYLEVENDTVIELGSYTITSSASVFSVAAGASLTVTADSSGGASTTGSGTSVFYLADSDDDTSTASLTINGGTYSSSDVVVFASASADITITDGSFSGTDAAVCAYNSGTLNISGGTFEGDLAVDLNTESATATLRSNNLTVNITGGTFIGSSMALNVSGYLSADDNITINITDGTFIGEVYIAGYTTTTISGGTFTDSSTSSDPAYGMQPLHIRSGNITITGGTFTNNHPLSYATWDYFYTASGSMEHYRDIVIEASNTSGFGALDSVTLTSGITTGNLGILYAINPGYTGDTPSSSIDSSLDVTEHSSSDLLYRIPFYYLSSSYAYFTSYSGAQTALSAMSSSYFYGQSIYAYDSDSGSWSVYSE